MDKLAHRKASRRILIKDASGVPVKNKEVQAHMRRHAFLFGSGAFDVLPLVDASTPETERPIYETIMEAWREVFSFGTLPFYLGRYEPEEGKTIEKEMHRAARWLNERDIITKGHPLCWHTVTAKWLLGKEPEEVLRISLERIKRDVTAFRGEIDMWDVINEVVIMPIFDKEDNAITRLCQKIGQVELVRLVFDEARRANPDACLLLNDFDTSEKYLHLAEDCLAAGADIDVIGIQSHQHQGKWGLEKLERVLTRFEKLGLPLHFTENTFVSGDLMPPEIVDLNDFKVTDWPSTPEGEDRQARDMIEMMDVLFERPAVHAFTTWCMIDGRWLNAPAGLLRKDGSKKPAFEALKQRVKKDWWTDTVIVTDDEGYAELTGFKGEYDLVYGGKTARITLDSGDETLSPDFC